jgi:hypothetical protein
MREKEGGGEGGSDAKQELRVLPKPSKRKREGNKIRKKTLFSAAAASALAGHPQFWTVRVAQI